MTPHVATHAHAVAQDDPANAVGFDVAGQPGMAEADIQTPCLVIDLDALERNLQRMADHARTMGIGLRVHAKMHKSLDIARLQHAIGGATGICCQKVSEAEVFARGGITDILVSNQVTEPAKIDRLARLPHFGARILVCVDDLANVEALSEAAMRHGTTIGCLVEIDCGAGRCGVAPGAEAVPIAQAIADAPGLSFEGLQAYQGAMQHFESHAERALAAGDVMRAVSATLEALGSAGLPCPIVGGGGTGSFEFEGNSGLFTELQCGSYAFMDAAYGRLTDATGAPVSQFENALFLLTSVMSHAKPDQAVCDAGLKVQSVDSGLPTVFGRDDVAYVKCSDEHGVIADPHGRLAIGDRLKLVPGHCDPTCNLHDHYIGVRGGVVETVWPVSARGKHF